MLKRFERGYHILRSVPVMQLLRRLQIMAWRRMEPRFLPAPPSDTPVWRDDLPKPLFAPRLEQWLVEPGQDGERVFLNLVWGKLELTCPMNWAPPLESRLAGSWRARLHYMEYLEGADDRWFEALVRDWIEQVSLQSKDMRLFGWRAFNLSIRAVVWMQQIALRRERLSPDLIDAMGRSLSHQLIYLERFLETDLRGNHLIKNMKALLWAGRCFQGRLADRWRALGERLLKAELDEQVLADGVHYERSPAYHCQVLADFLECRAVLDDGDLKDRLDAAIDRMAAALEHLVHPDDRVAQFNDGGLSMAYPPSLCLSVAGRPANRPEGAFSLPEAGFFGSRSGDDYLIIDCGKLAPDYLIGHGHGDILSFEWSLGGKRIIVDQGTYQNLGGPRRVKSRATTSHNTASIAGLDQGDFYGAHRCGRRPQAELLAFTPKDHELILEGRHDGYRHLPGRPWVWRQFQASPGRLVIMDEIRSDRPQQATSGLLLHPACRVERHDAGLDIIQDGVHLRMTADTEWRIEEAEWYPDLYCALPTRRIVVEFDTRMSSKLTFERLR